MRLLNLAISIMALEAVFGIISNAQTVDSIPKPKQDTFFLAKKRGLLGWLGKSVAIDCPLEVNGDIVPVKNSDAFMRFQGKTIGSIAISNVSFGISVNDTSLRKKNFFIDAATYLHKSTKASLVSKNLFFQLGDTLYPNLLADNIRYLREQSYLQDANIVVNPSKLDSNSVDVSVFYKDVFSIGASGEATEKNAYGEINDNNLMGTGQRIAIQGMYDLERNPRYGYGFEYLRRNVFGGFGNLGFGYQNLANAYSSGQRQESNWYMRVEQPLVSPYFLWTGAVEASVHYSNNQFNNDSVYATDINYSYRNFDSWAGYNVGGHNFSNEINDRKVKHFVATRIANRTFDKVPAKFENVYQPQYADLTSVLVAYTRFKQEYYRTNFLYGFGRNEDVPEGYNYSLVGGWTDKVGYSRPYVALDLQREYFSRKKSYFNYTLRLASYFRKNQMEDMSMLFNVETFTKLRRICHSKWLTRHFLTGSITHQFNQFLDDRLRLNGVYGIDQINSDSSTIANGRISISCVSVFYNTWKLAGFSFAPFSYVSLAGLHPDNQNWFTGDGYASIGCGMRTRNENLVFGTIECKISYFPRTVGGMTPFLFTISSDLQFKYNSQYIKRPDFISVN